MIQKIIKLGIKTIHDHCCPGCGATGITILKDKLECKSCFCQWIEIETNNPKICECCGKDVDHKCEDCGWVFGRRGWRQLGIYDG